MCKLGDGKVEIGRLRADKPLDVICIECLTVDKSIYDREQYMSGTYMLVITDCFSQFSKAIPTIIFRKFLLVIS